VKIEDMDAEIARMDAYLHWLAEDRVAELTTLLEEPWTPGMREYLSGELGKARARLARWAA